MTFGTGRGTVKRTEFFLPPTTKQSTCLLEFGFANARRDPFPLTRYTVERTRAISVANVARGGTL